MHYGTGRHQRPEEYVPLGNPGPGVAAGGERWRRCRPGILLLSHLAQELGADSLSQATNILVGNVKGDVGPETFECH